MGTETRLAIGTLLASFGGGEHCRLGLVPFSTRTDQCSVLDWTWSRCTLKDIFKHKDTTASTLTGGQSLAAMRHWN